MAVSIPKEGREVESRSDWATPKAVFDLISHCFGPFNLDPCASAENTKCPTYFTKDDNGLAQTWSGRAFLNPPYGRELPLWAEKAVHEMKTNGVVSVFLIPPRVGTPWFQDLCGHAESVLFLRGRIPFIDPAGNRTSPMDDNCVVILRPGKRKLEPTYFEFWDWKDHILNRYGEAAFLTVASKKELKERLEKKR